MDTLVLGSDALKVDDFAPVAAGTAKIVIDPKAVQKVATNRSYLEMKLTDSKATYYGINTGFGSLCNVRIDDDAIETLQLNLIRSHACGMGDLVPSEIVRIMLVLKAQNMVQGSSGVKISTIESLLGLYAHDILPEVKQLGSLGASGDLAPLAHLCLPILGEGFAYDGTKRERLPSSILLEQHGLQPHRLGAKEGLALLNGTQFSTAYAIYLLQKARKAVDAADAMAALSADVFLCQEGPWDPRIHRARPHPGQQKSASNIRYWLADSALAKLIRPAVQDPYAFRCVPQVHGASRDAMNWAIEVVEREINAVTDNPLVFHEEDLIVSGGNFHAQPIALALDLLTIALSEIGSISERRIFQLMSGQRGLPHYLAPDPGIESGLMIAQYTAASITSQNKQWCTPASADSVVSSNGQEDHVSMAANAATKCYKVLENVQRILGIEAVVNAQALEFRRPERSSEALEQWIGQLRKAVPALITDRVLSDDLDIATTLVKTYDWALDKR